MLSSQRERERGGGRVTETDPSLYELHAVVPVEDVGDGVVPRAQVLPQTHVPESAKKRIASSPSNGQTEGLSKRYKIIGIFWGF